MKAGCVVGLSLVNPIDNFVICHICVRLYLRCQVLASRVVEKVEETKVELTFCLVIWVTINITSVRIGTNLDLL